MMIKDVMPSFELYQPTQLKDAFALLDRYGKDGWKMAGGYDSLSWFKERIKRPKAVIDLATLTGAIVQTLGFEHAGIFSNDDELVERGRTARPHGQSGLPQAAVGRHSP